MLQSSSLVHQGNAQVQVCDTERKNFERENVCVCVCVRERERERENVHIKTHVHYYRWGERGKQERAGVD